MHIVKSCSLVTLLVPGILAAFYNAPSTDVVTQCQNYTGQAKYYISVPYTIEGSVLIKATSGTCNEESSDLTSGYIDRGEHSRFWILVDMVACGLDRITYDYSQRQTTMRDYYMANITHISIGKEQDGNDFIMASYDIVTECGFQKYYQLSHQYGEIEDYVGHDEIYPGANPPINFIYREHVDDTFIEEMHDSNPRRAGSMAFVSLTAHGMDVSEFTFHVPSCKIVTDTGKEVALFRHFGEYDRTPIRLEVDYRIRNNTQQFLITHRFFVLDRQVGVKYNLTCDIVVCRAGLVGDDCEVKQLCQDKFCVADTTLDTTDVDGMPLGSYNANREVVVTLTWAADGSENGPFGCDYDVSVTEPNGQRISFIDMKSDTGGRLDVDDRGGNDALNVENISWAVSPKGQFLVKVGVYNRSTCSGGDATLKYTIDGVSTTHQLDLSNPTGSWHIDGPGFTIV